MGIGTLNCIAGAIQNNGKTTTTTAKRSKREQDVAVNLVESETPTATWATNWKPNAYFYRSPRFRDKKNSRWRIKHDVKQNKNRHTPRRNTHTIPNQCPCIPPCCTKTVCQREGNVAINGRLSTQFCGRIGCLGADKKIISGVILCINTHTSQQHLLQMAPPQWLDLLQYSFWSFQIRTNGFWRRWPINPLEKVDVIPREMFLLW